MRESIAALIAQLADPQAGDAAVESLVALGEAAVPALGAAVRHWRSPVRRRAMVALASIGGDAAAEALYGVLTRPSFWDLSPTSHYTGIMRALIQVGSPAVAPLCRWLRSPNVHLIDAVEALEAIGDAGAAGPLLEQLEIIPEDDPRYGRIIRALSRFPDARMIPVFLRALFLPDRHVRECAAGALAALGWEPRNPRERVLYALAGDDASHVADLGEDAVLALHKLLQGSIPLRRRRAAECLGLIGCSEALPALREQKNPLIEFDYTVIRAASRAIRQIEWTTRETAHRPRAGDAMTPPARGRPRAGDEPPDGVGRPRAD